MRRAVALAVCAAALLGAGAARAQTTLSTGIAADRFVPGLGPVTFLGGEGAATTPAGSISVAVGVSGIGDPLVLRNRDTGELVSKPVATMGTFDVGMEVGVWKRLALSIGLPIVMRATGDRLNGVSDDTRPLTAPTLGDLRFRAKVSLSGRPLDRGLHAALLLQVGVGLTGRDDFAATDGATVEPRLVVDYRLPYVALYASLGARFAPERVLFTTKFSDELTWMLGAAAEPWRRGSLALRLIAESAGAVGGGAGTRPVELRGGAGFAVGIWSLDLAAGGGLTSDATAPAWRVLAILRATWDARH